MDNFESFRNKCFIGGKNSKEQQKAKAEVRIQNWPPKCNENLWENAG